MSTQANPKEARPPFALQPMRFDPIFEYRPWGGRRLGPLLSADLPGMGPIGEAWVLSDREGFPCRVSEGPLQGWSLGQVLREWPMELLGEQHKQLQKFPLLLKFLDVGEPLSIQVHPSDTQTRYLPQGEQGKTEAWVVLETGPRAIIYQGLKPGTRQEDLRRALETGNLPDCLGSFKPVPGDAVFLPAGTVHSLGDCVVFEVQENSDMTFRLDDWGHVDPSTGRGRALQVNEAMACIDYTLDRAGPAEPQVEMGTPVLRERLFHCEHFGLWRIKGSAPFTVGAIGTPRVLVCLAGSGALEAGGAPCAIRKGEVLVVPAVAGLCTFHPEGSTTILEVSMLEGVCDNSSSST